MVKNRKLIKMRVATSNSNSNNLRKRECNAQKKIKFTCEPCRGQLWELNRQLRVEPTLFNCQINCWCYNEHICSLYSWCSLDYDSSMGASRLSISTLIPSVETVSLSYLSFCLRVAGLKKHCWQIGPSPPDCPYYIISLLPPPTPLLG